MSPDWPKEFLLPKGEGEDEGEPCSMTRCQVMSCRCRTESFRQGRKILVVLAAMACIICPADPPDQNTGTNSFPAPADVFHGRTFPNKSERDVFFLQAIHDRYSSQWPALLEANINVTEYVQSPAKLLQFINELGTAMAGRNDPEASARLALITSDKNFFANTNGYVPEILQAAARALIKIGPNGRKALAASFSESHYRDDPESLEDLARVIGEERPPDPEIAQVLAATSFRFSTSNGASYSRCTTETVQNLLRLPEGTSIVRTNLNKPEVLADPGRFQAVILAIATARAAELTTNLVALESDATAKLATLTNSPGPYRDDLEQLQACIQKAVTELQSPLSRSN